MRLPGRVVDRDRNFQVKGACIATKGFQLRIDVVLVLQAAQRGPVDAAPLGDVGQAQAPRLAG